MSCDGSTMAWQRILRFCTMLVRKFVEESSGSEIILEKKVAELGPPELWR